MNKNEAKKAREQMMMTLSRAFIRKLSTSAENCRDSLESRWAIGAAKKKYLKFKHKIQLSLHTIFP